MKRHYRIPATFFAGAFLAISAVAYAAGDTIHHGPEGHFPGLPGRPIAGTVSAISGSELSLSVASSSTDAILTTYTVETSNAKVLRSGASTTPASIAVGDKITVIGALSGTDITARLIIEGIVPHTTSPPFVKKGGQTGSLNGRLFASSTRPFMKPPTSGTVSSLGNSTFDMTERTGAGTTTLVIDTDSQTAFREGTTTASFSSLAVGNLVAVTGTTTATDEILASRVLIMRKPEFRQESGSSQSSHPFLGTFKGRFQGRIAGGRASTTPSTAI